MDKAVVTCALTGVLTNPEQHPVPVTPAEMAQEAKSAFDAGLVSNWFLRPHSNVDTVELVSRQHGNRMLLLVGLDSLLDLWACGTRGTGRPGLRG